MLREVREDLRDVPEADQLRAVALGHRHVRRLLQQLRQEVQDVQRDHAFRRHAVGQRTLRRVLRRLREDLQDLQRHHRLGLTALGHTALRPLLRRLRQDLQPVQRQIVDGTAALGHRPLRQVLRPTSAKRQRVEFGRLGGHRHAIRLLRGPWSIAANVVFADRRGHGGIPGNDICSRADDCKLRGDGGPRSAGDVGRPARRAGGVCRHHCNRCRERRALPLRLQLLLVRFGLGGSEHATSRERGPRCLLREKRGTRGAQPSGPARVDRRLGRGLPGAADVRPGEPGLRLCGQRERIQRLLRERLLCCRHLRGLCCLVGMGGPQAEVELAHTRWCP
mmetsp:Transcript_116222/g.290194  ORF Transcript_116222/g.290194 Transcript_116222/m.290194 type:complete len:335 (+) Transcript_116222:1081-2085(+)